MNVSEVTERSAVNITWEREVVIYTAFKMQIHKSNCLKSVHVLKHTPWFTGPYFRTPQIKLNVKTLKPRKMSVFTQMYGVQGKRHSVHVG